jgi:hypothetical protein
MGVLEVYYWSRALSLVCEVALRSPTSWKSRSRRSVVCVMVSLPFKLFVAELNHYLFIKGMEVRGVTLISIDCLH